MVAVGVGLDDGAGRHHGVIAHGQRSTVIEHDVAVHEDAVAELDVLAGTEENVVMEDDVVADRFEDLLRQDAAEPDGEVLHECRGVWSNIRQNMT